jgi:hypothetical protein
MTEDAMPRFLLELEITGRDQRNVAARLLAERFPEISVEQRYSTHSERGERELWVCRAPSETHLRRWTEAADLAALTTGYVAGGGDSLTVG